MNRGCVYKCEMGSSERPQILNRAVHMTMQNYGVAAILASIFLLILLPWWIQQILLYVGGILFLCTIIAPFIDDWRPRARVHREDKAVFISEFWALVNNAGLPGCGEISWLSVEMFQCIFGVNTFGAVRLTKAFLPLLCKDKGRVINVASAAGRNTYPFIVPYCMSKTATVSFSEGLRFEMYKFDVTVVSIEPFMYKTRITESDKTLKDVMKAWEESPDEVKKLYPEGYIERYKRLVLKFLSWSISDKPQEVVNCMEEAVLAYDPKYVYNPGTFFSRFFHWLLMRLPKPIADGLMFDEFAVRITK